MRPIIFAALALALTSCQAIKSETAADGYQVAVKEPSRQLLGGSASAIGVVGYNAASMLPETWKGGKFYGNWCGMKVPADPEFDWFMASAAKGTIDKLPADSDLRPIDDVDYFCMKHDICYGIAKTSVIYSQHDCDHNLQIDLNRLARKAEADKLPIILKILSWVGGGQLRDKDLRMQPYRPIVPDSYLLVPIEKT